MPERSWVQPAHSVMRSVTEQNIATLAKARGITPDEARRLLEQAKTATVSYGAGKRH